MEAGLQKHAELIRRLPSKGFPVNGEERIEFQHPTAHGGTSNVEDFMVVPSAKSGEVGAIDSHRGDCTESSVDESGDNGRTLEAGPIRKHIGKAE